LSAAHVVRSMHEHDTTPHADPERARRLVQAVEGLPFCNLYFAWRNMGAAGLETGLQNRSDAHEHGSTQSEKDHRCGGGDEPSGPAGGDSPAATAEQELRRDLQRPRIWRAGGSKHRPERRDGWLSVPWMNAGAKA
jgi:hypothetical protein